MSDDAIRAIVDSVTPPIYDRSDVFYDPPSSKISLCGCMGAMYGEPFCPCSMRSQGLPLSKEHVKELAASRERFEKIDWSKWEAK